jgi:hypothetical protein
MKIETFKISRVHGRSENWYPLGLIKSHVDALNEIGETGYLNEKKTSLQDFFDTHIEVPRKTKYKVEQLEVDLKATHGKDTLLVVRCTA